VIAIKAIIINQENANGINRQDLLAIKTKLTEQAPSGNVTPTSESKHPEVSDIDVIGATQ